MMTIEFVRTWPEAKWALTRIHAAFGVFTVPGVLKRMLDHDQERIRDVN
jgi:hypothetical protein